MILKCYYNGLGVASGQGFLKCACSTIWKVPVAPIFYLLICANHKRGWSKGDRAISGWRQGGVLSSFLPSCSCLPNCLLDHLEQGTLWSGPSSQFQGELGHKALLFSNDLFSFQSFYHLITPIHLRGKPRAEQGWVPEKWVASSSLSYTQFYKNWVTEVISAQSLVLIWLCLLHDSSTYQVCDLGQSDLLFQDLSLCIINYYNMSNLIRVMMRLIWIT